MSVENIEIPDGVTVAVSGQKVSVKGPKGSVEREFRVKGLKITQEGKQIAMKSDGVSLAMMNTTMSHMRNLLAGVTQGYEKKMQMIYSHFPIQLEVKPGQLMIKNFLGEKVPRTANIIGATKVEVKGQNATITGVNKEHVGQTVANIKTACKIRNRDPRVFQDGLYEVE